MVNSLKIKSITLSVENYTDIKQSIYKNDFLNLIFSKLPDDTIIILTDGFGKEILKSSVKQIKGKRSI